MTRIGLITEPKINEQKHIFRKHKIKSLKSGKNPFELIIVILPFKTEGVFSTEKRTLARRIKSAEKILREKGAEGIVFSQKIKEGYGELLNFEKNREEKRKVFFEAAPVVMRKLAPDCGIDLMQAGICIRANKMDRISGYLMREMCYDTKSLVICTTDKETARSFCDEFCEETGMPVKICETISATALDVVVDIDEMLIRIGRDLIIDGIEIDFDLGGYEADTLDIATHIKDLKIENKVSACFSNKKKLTLLR